ncbi:peptidylprolyl isomerase [Agarilytica rhodophyticola]|uniref:peptidylprolyl isomerase n=1 Tax=Agarilytica rhodophyticola TaxID=1737490 RepID=UPI000B343843|nr:peptidylprolyl isomerase [Agarilytica rhodophyticola]
MHFIFGYKQLLNALFIIFALSCSSFSIAEKITAEKKASSAAPKVLLETSSGNILIELFPKQAPLTVANFLKYVDDGFYSGTIFHRVVPGFVVQAGGYTFDFKKKETREPIKNESDNKLKNLVGTLSMARTGVIDSATSQFFINIADNDALDFSSGSHGYAVFGKVIEGFEIVKKIEKEPRGLYRQYPEAPNYPVIIEKASRQ